MSADAGGAAGGGAEVGGGAEAGGGAEVGGGAEAGARTALRDVRRIARFYRELQRAGGEGARPGPQPLTAGITLGGLANLLCLRAEVDARTGDRAAAGAACRAAEILADQIGAQPASSLRRRVAALRARLGR